MIRCMVCFTASDTWYGKLIRRLTGAQYNHAFLAYESKTHGGWQALQTDERGVVEVPAESIKYSEIACCEIPHIDIVSAFPEIRGFIGSSYDWLGILGFLLKLIVWRLFFKKIGNPLHTTGELFCSEFTTMTLQHVPWIDGRVMDLNPEDVAPDGDPAFTGTPSLYYTLKPIAVWFAKAPWEQRSLAA